MKDVRVDTAGELRCWHCGCTSFTEKRTFRAKAIGATVGVATLGIGALATPLLTKKKMKCRICGEYNDVGNARPYKGPSSSRLGKKYGTMVSMFGEAEPDRVIASVYDQPGQTSALPAPPTPPKPTTVPAGWHRDPHGRHEMRYWDGARWTEHVSDGGTVSTD